MLGKLDFNALAKTKYQLAFWILLRNQQRQNCSKIVLLIKTCSLVTFIYEKITLLVTSSICSTIFSIKWPLLRDTYSKFGFSKCLYAFFCFTRDAAFNLAVFLKYLLVNTSIILNPPVVDKCSEWSGLRRLIVYGYNT